MQLKQKLGVEIFSVGVWNGDKYTIEDFDEMVRAYNDTAEGWKPPLKLGHDEDQKLLQTDGYPAAGYVGKLYRRGTKLIADFIDIPAKIYELLEHRSYKKVSAEIFWDVTVGDEKEPKNYSRMLAGVALLGADMPAVMNLSDILAWYRKAGTEKKFYTDPEKQPNLKTYEFSEGGEMDAAKELEKLKADKIAADKELADLKKYKTDQEAKAKSTEDEIAELKEQNRQTALDSEVAEIEEISPAMKPYAKALLDTSKAPKKYSIKIGKGKDAETKEYASRGELLNELLKLHAEALKLNTNEESEEGEAEEQEESGDEKVLDKKVRAYAKEHKCSYGNALKAVRASAGPGDEDEENEDEDEE